MHLNSIIKIEFRRLEQAVGRGEPSPLPAFCHSFEKTLSLEHGAKPRGVPRSAASPPPRYDAAAGLAQRDNVSPRTAALRVGAGD